MRRLSFFCAWVAILAAPLIGAGVAEADVHLGSVVAAAESNPAPCLPGFALIQATSDPDTPYTAPPGDRKLTRWEMSTASSTAGAPVTLLVLRPAGEGSYDIVATDAEALPNPLPADGLAAFAPASPIAMSGGEVLGLSSSTSGLGCGFSGGETPTAASVAVLETPVAPAPGQVLTPFSPETAAGVTLNLAATLRGDQDAGVATSASPEDVTVGALALLGSTVTNHGLESTPVTFTDTIPSGLTVDSVFAGSNSCVTAGRTVTCTIEGLAPGQSAPVSVLVTPTAAGSYVNTVSVAPQAGITDPATADDSATARLDVAGGLVPGAPPKSPLHVGSILRVCIVPNFRGVTLTAAKHFLGPLGCRAGKVRHAHERKLAKGKVIRTSPKPGTYAAGRKVVLVVSSGPPRHGHHRHDRT